MFKRVLIANRGAIACRIQRTLRKLGVESVCVYSNADRESLHTLEADHKVHLPGNLPAETYLQVDRILEAARELGAEAIHPGYGFLSEQSGFGRACEEAGIAFIGPTPDQLDTCGLKHVCRDIAREAGVPLLEGSALLETEEQALEVAESIGYPVILKSSAGGGGIGMQIIRSAEELPSRFAAVRRLSEANFGDAGMFIEKYIENARHIEVQVFGDGEGNVLSLGERDCSVQRRNQKVIEESPAPGLTDEDRNRLSEAALNLTRSVNYRNAGTVEFLWDADARQFYFLEINARLQVEHGVTEEVTGVDLVEWMIRLAAGELPSLTELEPTIQRNGHAIQARLYAEDPNKDYQPSTGLITCFSVPDEVRCDTWVESGTEVSMFYDPMVAKIIAHDVSRKDASRKLIRALKHMECAGIETNRAYLRQILGSHAFLDGEITTRFLNTFSYRPRTIDILDPGLETTVQDYPGRIGKWDVGVPPSGPFDSLSFRLGNRILGNLGTAAGLEMAVRGGRFRFNTASTICLAGADMGATVDGNPIPQYEAVRVSAGSVLKFGNIQGLGQRSYLLVRGGINVPEYLGSRATFRLGRFGGHGGRALRPGDVLAIDRMEDTDPAEFVNPAILPTLRKEWNVRVVYGPHGAPEFFTQEDMDTFFKADWEVHYNSDRTGVRLIGPRPEWARRDGGEAGLHPSNIHDNAYCVGSVDFTGDMPILLGPDGPSLGGFVCPAVIARVDLWKLGQVKPGDTVRFHAVTNVEAETALVAMEGQIESLQPAPFTIAKGQRYPMGLPVVQTLPETEDRPSVCFRQSGDGVLLVEYGELVLDLDLRFRVQALHDNLKAEPFDGLLEIVPGIRSLQVQFDPTVISARQVLGMIEERELNLPPAAEMEFPSRIVHLPLSWDDPATREAIQRYMQIVRKDAPWCPSNIEFIRRINGLESIDDVYRTVFDASYFVLGLGDVYLGAPVATPLDPRHRLVTTKYNPARTWTPENAVGIGGAYLCIYGMEGPGGYQFVGRTLPIWNRFHSTKEFVDGKPWLLRFFDQIRWYPVEADELLEMRRSFLTGESGIEIEETTFRPADYHQFLSENSEEIASFREQQRTAFDEERQRWEESGAMSFKVEEPDLSQSQSEEIEIPEGHEPILSPVAGSLWKLQCSEGDTLAEDDLILILESMKMEINVQAPSAGKLTKILVEDGASVRPGQVLAILELTP